MMNCESSEEVLQYITDRLIDYLDNDLSEQPECYDDWEFVFGEKTAYVEVLEMIRERWDHASDNGLDFEIEKRFPIMLEDILKNKKE